MPQKLIASPAVTNYGSVIDWLLDSDPSIRWQVMRDLLDTPESEWRAERAKVETEGWGARLLSYEDEDGQWAGGAFSPSNFDAREWQELGQPWTNDIKLSGDGSSQKMIFVSGVSRVVWPGLRVLYRPPGRLVLRS